VRNPVAEASVSTLKLVQSNSLALLVQQEITGMILNGEIVTGEWLNEAALSQHFGVSRGPIREAFRSLEESGLLRQEKNKGAFVREVTLGEAEEIYEIREVLDELIGRKVANNVSKGQLRILGSTVAEMDHAAALDDVGLYYSLNLKFHDLLSEHAGNSKLTVAYRRLINQLHVFRLGGLSHMGGLQKSNKEHHAMLNAIRSRDAEAAARAFRFHVTASRRRMQVHFGDQGSTA
jgi:phosphonate utilization transcriptional regulator